ncbi:MAG: CHAT domain-containing protein [Hyalangium sp.]|uniref:CHAT domain-containing protein n=1 Tax=Hyalangium sp. TaxID=2028555 RepID=UPI00389B02D2
MEIYYHHLLAGQGRATALREAMRELRQTQPHPHSWAPFIVMGRDTPLRLLAPSSQEARAPDGLSSRWPEPGAGGPPAGAAGR